MMILAVIYIALLFLEQQECVAQMTGLQFIVSEMAIPIILYSIIPFSPPCLGFHRMKAAY